MATRLSLTNHLATATLLPAPAHQAGWPATNVKFPQQPFVPAKTTDLSGDKNYIWDLGSAKLIEIMLAINVNYPQIAFFVDNDGNYTPADYTMFPHPSTISRNPWNRRYTFAHILTTPQTKRFMQLRIPSGAGVIDGSSAYSTGGFWAGPLTALPSDIRWNERPAIIEPGIDEPLIGGGTHRVSTGRPHVRMQARRLARVAIATPATGDQLGSWLEIDRLWAAAGPAAWFFNRGNTSEAFIFRKMNASDWNVNQILSEDDLLCEEVVGP